MTDTPSVPPGGVTFERVCAAKAVIGRAAHRPVGVGRARHVERHGIVGDDGRQGAESGPRGEDVLARDDETERIVGEIRSLSGTILVAGLSDLRRVAVAASIRDVEQPDVATERDVRVPVVARHRARGNKTVRHLPGPAVASPSYSKRFFASVTCRLQSCTVCCATAFKTRTGERLRRGVIDMNANDCHWWRYRRRQGRLVGAIGDPAEIVERRDEGARLHDFVLEITSAVPAAVPGVPRQERRSSAGQSHAPRIGPRNRGCSCS